MSLPEEMYLRYQGLLLPRQNNSCESLNFAQEFKFENDDVLVVTYPKSGVLGLVQHTFSGLVESMAPQVLAAKRGIEIILDRYNLDAGDPPVGAEWGDLTPIHTIANWRRVPCFPNKIFLLTVDKLASPRALVTHFPYNLMPPSFYTSKAKVIYVMRNPKDILVSSYYFHQMAGFLEDPGTFDEFMDKFLEGEVLFGKWTDHMKGWRNSDLGDRIMYITYEEMVQDLPASLRRISDFLGRNLTEEVIQKIAEHCSFKTMKTNNMSNFSLIPKVYMDSDKSPFLRKGIVGDWKNHFTSEQLARFTSVISKELEGESFSLPWSLD